MRLLKPNLVLLMINGWHSALGTLPRDSLATGQYGWLHHGFGHRIGLTGAAACSTGPVGEVNESLGSSRP